VCRDDGSLAIRALRADANIIVGATFDESIVGTIRVSVVATGVEIRASSLTPSAPRHDTAEIHEAVIAEVRRTTAMCSKSGGQKCLSRGILRYRYQ
jgi:cell division GTPase FtsZ